MYQTKGDGHMKSWSQLFIRQGWLLQETGENTFSRAQETDANLSFLMACLDRAQTTYIYNEQAGTLQMTSPPLPEEAWLEVVNVAGRGKTESIATSKERLRVEKLDLYISGIVRQLHRLNMMTTVSCDGDGQARPAKIWISKDYDVDVALLENLLSLELPRVHRREGRGSIIFILGERSAAHLNLAETLSKISVDWLEHGIDYIKQQLFYVSLEELLLIPGTSGEEGRVRNAVMDKLSPYVDHMTVDSYGNILAEKKFRSGNGPTILLNAHLDVYEELAEHRVIVKDNGIWSSSEGILGADDRAGVAVILEVAKALQHETDFSGRVKYILTVEEEIGLVGARNVAPYFLWDVDAAIVVDRRGTGDIVTSCGGFLPFCDAAYGNWLEQQASEAGLTGWKCTAGGSSDTRIWAEQGIQSVNLSVGYYNEHTEDERLDVHACYNTAKLVKSVIHNSRSLRLALRANRQLL